MMEKVTVDFDGFKALTKVNLELTPGALRILIGPNGAGKSTLCDTIIGRVRPTSGRIIFKDQEILRHFLNRRSCGAASAGSSRRRACCRR